MSPGYDLPKHDTFERAATLECLACHAGRVEPVDGSVHRMTFHEQVIGCENCHGAGSLHRDRRRLGKVAPGEEDLTIVNPGKLPRPLLEDICARCHQNGAASILVRGRQHTDFRPGQPLTDYRIDYQFDVGNEQMTVVGHMEQLRRSACYQKSPELSCLSCHDPHAREKPRDAVAYYRQKCLNCHTSKSCSLEPAQRRRQDAADNCAACHMPRGDTDIPHIAFTHHRIGRHPAPAAHAERTPGLIPIGDIEQLPPLDRTRNLGLAYAYAAQIPPNARYAAEFGRRARDLLDSVHAAGLRQDETTAALWVLNRHSDPHRALELARELLDARRVSPTERVRTQLSLAFFELRDGSLDSAVGILEDLTRLRRNAEDWRLLGLAHLEQEQPKKALAAFQHALTIRPQRASLHAGLAEAYRRLGNAALAQEHDDKARWLMEHGQD